MHSWTSSPTRIPNIPRTARLNRLAWQHARDPRTPGVTELIDTLLAATWRRTHPVPADVPGGAAVQHTADWTLLHQTLATAEDPGLQPPVRSRLRGALRRLADELRPREDDDHAREAAELIGRWLADPDAVRLDPLPRIPPGAPN